MEKTLLLTIEEAALNAWSTPKQVFYDGWVLRFTGGQSKRVNSVNPLYPSTLPLNEKIRTCEAIYAHQGLPPLFRVPEINNDADLVKVLDTCGYKPFEPTVVLGRALGNCIQSEPADELEVSIHEMFVEDWFRLRSQFIAVSEDDLQAHKLILSCIVPEKVLLGMFVGDQPVACGMGVVEGALLGFFSIYVSAEWRRRNFASMIMNALIKWGLLHGANYGYLQVEGHNKPALALYNHLGFAPCYWYTYYQK
jgi:GNAT superfamily N-acetyltransferase